VRQLPPGCRTRLATGDTDSVWGLPEHLLALAIDELRAANWQRGNEGAPRSKQSPRPKPVPRPGAGQRPPESPQRAVARAAALERARARRAAIAAGQIT
jgi:hypothetical protein